MSDYLYGRKYWNWFVENIGASFNQKSKEKPIIYYEGKTEDNIEVDNERIAFELEIMPEGYDYLLCKVYYMDENELRLKKMWIHFAIIDEVQTDQFCVEEIE